MGHKESHTYLHIQLLTVLLIAGAIAALVVILYYCMTVLWFNNSTHSSTSLLWRRTPFVAAQRGEQQQQTPSTTSTTTMAENSMNELIPAHKYCKGGRHGTVAVGGEDGDGDDDGMCAVCLCEFEDGEELRTMPECVHSFHVECIDMWLYSHSTCPLCRTDTPSPSPSPHYMFTPLLDSAFRGSTIPPSANHVVPNFSVLFGSVMMV
ncbi:unnamed protein product [Camellia sinensis]